MLSCKRERTAEDMSREKEPLAKILRYSRLLVERIRQIAQRLCMAWEGKDKFRFAPVL